MHILYLLAPGGGLETNVRVLAPALVQAGHRVSILYLDSSVRALTHTQANGIAEYRAPTGQLHYYLHRATFGLASLGLLARSFEFGRAVARTVHAIHIQVPLDLVELPEVNLSAGQLPVPFVIRLHASAWMCRRLFHAPIPPTDAVEIRLEARTLKQAAAVTSPSRFTAEYVAQACKVQRPIEIIPYPVDTGVFKPTDQPKRRMVLFVGRVEKPKGADTLMRAIPAVLAVFPDCEFVFAGRLSEELRTLAAAMPPPVKFLGVIPRTALVTLYQQASLLVLPSLFDNSPNVIYEAMACGTPVVATRVGGIPELVEDGVTGLLVPPRDIDQLSRALIQLLQLSGDQTKMRMAARARTVKNYAVKPVLERTLTLYQSVV